MPTISRVSIRRQYFREWGYQLPFVQVAQNLTSRVDRETLGVWYVQVIVWRYECYVTGAV